MVSRLLVAACMAIALLGLGIDYARMAAPPFNDVPADHPAYTAINELASRGIIRGCDPEAGLFCPEAPTLRAQMAALIARALGWDAEDHGNQFADRCDPSQGCIDDDLWRNVGALQFYEVAKGYDAATYGPHNLVLEQQVILFIARGLVVKGQWMRQPDNAAIYPNLPRGSDAEKRDAQDIVTYVHYAGVAPDTDASANWGTYAQWSSRAWFARALWQAINPAGPGPRPSPLTSPSAMPEPTPSPSALPSVQPSPDPSPSMQPSCSPAYPTVCIPPPPPDLNCGDISYRRFQVLPPDPHGFDRDHNGVGCEQD